MIFYQHMTHFPPFLLWTRNASVFSLKTLSSFNRKLIYIDVLVHLLALTQTWLFYVLGLLFFTFLFYAVSITAVILFYIYYASVSTSMQQYYA